MLDNLTAQAKAKLPHKFYQDRIVNSSAGKQKLRR